MYINTFKYRPEDVACVLCAEYVKKLGCTALSCPCLAERMEAGVVGYEEAVAELFPLHPRLTPRILRLVAGFPGSLWQDEQHKRRFTSLRTLLGYRKKRDTPVASDEDIPLRFKIEQSSYKTTLLGFNGTITITALD